MKHPTEVVFFFFATLGSPTTFHSLTHCLLSPWCSWPDPVPPLHLSSTCSALRLMSSHDPLPYCLKTGIYGLQYLSEKWVIAHLQRHDSPVGCAETAPQRHTNMSGEPRGEDCRMGRSAWSKKQRRAKVHSAHFYLITVGEQKGWRIMITRPRKTNVSIAHGGQAGSSGQSCGNTHFISHFAIFFSPRFWGRGTGRAMCWTHLVKAEGRSVVCCTGSWQGEREFNTPLMGSAPK